MRRNGKRAAREAARLEKLEALAIALEERGPRVRARWKELEPIVAHAAKAEARGAASVIEAGRALEEVRAGKLWRLSGWRTMAEWMASIGLSKLRAHKWRVIARAGDGEGSVGASYRSARASDAARRTARAIVERFAAVGADGEIRAREGDAVAVVMGVKEWRRVLEAMG